MTYHDDVNPGGVIVDGGQDRLLPGSLKWEMVTGEQGTLVHALFVATTIPDLTATSYYSDQAAPAVVQCTGDDHEYATSGPWIDEPIPNTDPLLPGEPYELTLVRIVTYEQPFADVALAERRFEQASHPLVATAKKP